MVRIPKKPCDCIWLGLTWNSWIGHTETKRILWKKKNYERKWSGIILISFRLKFLRKLLVAWSFKPIRRVDCWKERGEESSEIGKSTWTSIEERGECLKEMFSAREKNKKEEQVKKTEKSHQRKKIIMILSKLHFYLIKSIILYFIFKHGW